MATKTKAKPTKRGFGNVRQLPSGRYQVVYTGPNLIRYKCPEGTFATKLDAEGWASNERRLIDLGIWTPPDERKAAAEAEAKPMTLREYAEGWIETADLAPRTRREYRDKLRLYILPELGSVALAAIDRDMVKTWMAGLGNDHPTRNRHAYGVLSACLNAAIESKTRGVEPTFAVKGALRVQARKHNDMLTPAELANVAAAMTDPADCFAVLLMAWCGFRPGEVFELRRKDVSRNRAKVTASRSVSRDRETLSWVVGPTKTEDIRTVELPPHLVPMMKDHLTSVDKGAEALLFPDPTGGHMRQRQFSDRFKAALTAAGVESDLRVYDLRAFGGTMALLAGGSLRDAMDRLGHKTPNAAMHYQRATRGSEVAKRLSALAGVQ